MEVGGHQNIGILKLMWNDVIRNDMNDMYSKDRRSTRPENVENKNLMRRPQGKGSRGRRSESHTPGSPMCDQGL